MSDTLHYDAGRLMLGDVELYIDDHDHVEVQEADGWHPGIVRFERSRQAFYIELPNPNRRVMSRTIWMWEGLPARLTSPRPGTPPAR